MSYSIQKADIAEHKELLIALWERNYQGVIEGRFAWIYENNSNGTPVVYLLKHEATHSFVGALTLFPRAIFNNGKRIKAYICGDMVVDIGHRSLGPAISLLKASIRKCHEDAPCVLISFPNEKSEPVALRSGFKVLGEYCEMTRIIKTQRYLLRYMSSPVIARALSLVLDWLLRLRYEVFFPFTTKHYNCEIVSEFDKKFDELGDRIAQNFNFIGERDCCFLNWRIKDSPYSQYKIFILTSKENTVIHGYIAYFVVDKRVHVADIAFDRNNKIFSTLFFLFNKYQINQRNDSIVISIAANLSLVNQLKSRGYSMRGMKNKVITYSSSEQLDLTQKINDGDWYLTSADNDI